MVSPVLTAAVTVLNLIVISLLAKRHERAYPGGTHKSNFDAEPPSDVSATIGCTER